MYKIYLDSSKRKEKRIELWEINRDQKEVKDFVEGEFDIVSEILKMLAKYNLQPKDIEEFVPFLGPGSFTGLKNGVTVCNVLNWALGKKDLNNMQMPDYGGEPNIQPPLK